MSAIDPDNSMRASPSDTKHSDSGTLPAPLADFIRAAKTDDLNLAAQNLLDEHLQRILPHGQDCLSWIARHVGADATRKIVEALVHYTCFYCRIGRISCETCDGRGGGPIDAVCDDCSGLGERACEFCGGSGRLALSALPAGLREWIQRERTRIGAHRAARIIQDWRTRATIPETEHRSRYKALIQEVFHLNRVLAMLENTVDAEHEGLLNGQLPSREGKTHALVLQSARALVSIQRKLVRRIVEFCMSASLRQELSALDQERWKARAEYYQARLDRGGRTPNLIFSHPTLARELEKPSAPCGPTTSP